MRLVIWLVLLSVGAVLAAWILDNNQGHITMYWNLYRIDLSMNLFIILLFVGFLGCFILFSFLSSIFNLPVRAEQYRAQQRAIRASRELAVAVDHLFAGRFLKALKSVHVVTQFSETAEYGRMIAAQAYHQLNQTAQRDAELEKITGFAHQQAKLVMLAQMQVEDRNPEAALATIAQLQGGGARQFIVQRIALLAHRRLENWPEVVRLANSLVKRQFLPALVGQARIQEGLTQWIKSKNISKDRLLQEWQEFGEQDQVDPHWVRLFAEGFIRVGEHQKAKQILEKVIPHEPSFALVMLYFRCADKKAHSTVLALALIHRVEQWLLQDPAQPALHLALGLLSVEQQLWGKAIASLQRVLDSPRADQKMLLQAHLTFVQIYEELEDDEKSAEHRKNALRFFTTKAS